MKTLTKDGLICASQTHAASYYTITEKGLETLNFFCSKLPKDTMQQIDDYLAKHKIQITEDTSIRTDYTRTDLDEYLARCTVVERGCTVFEVALNVMTEEEAIDVCRRFKEKSDTIYSFLYKELSTN